MSTQKRSVLKNWFRKGLIPTQVQFADAFDSFFHKSEDLIPLSQVDGLVTELNNKKYELQEYLNTKLKEAVTELDNSVNDNSETTVSCITFGGDDDGLWMELTMLSGTKNRVPLSIPLATTEHDGMMSAEDRVMLATLALQASKSVITVAGMDFTHGDILEILKGHRPTRYAVMYETETNSYVCGILDAYTSRDGCIFTEIYTGGCDLAKDFTGGTHDSGRIYQFMRQYRIVGSGTPAAGTWSAWQSCLSSAAMDELYAMGLDYKVYEDLEDGYIEVKLTGKEGGVVGGSTEIPFASSAKSGFMSKEDKARLDGMEDEANKTIVLQEHGTDEKAVMSQAAVTLADAEIQKELNSEKLNRSKSDAALQEQIDELESTVPTELRVYYSDDGVSLDLERNDEQLFCDTIEPATNKSAGVMSAGDKVMLDALALQASKSVISVDGMDFSLDDILEILKGHRPTRYAVKYETETSSYVCGIVDVYTSRDGSMFTEIYTGGCNLAVDYTGGTHDSSKIYQFMRQYRIFGSGTPAVGTWSAWQSCLSSAAMEELYAMGMDYKVYEGETDGYIEVKLIGKDGGVVGGSTEIPFASAEKSGFMSREDKGKLDEMEAGANRTTVTQEHGTSENAVMSQAAVTQADAELLLRIQGRSEDSMPYYDPFKYVLFQGSNYLTEFNDWLDGLHTTDGGGDPSKAGFFRVSLWGLLCEVKNFVINWERMKFHQIVEGTISIDSQGRLGLSEGFSILQRRYEDGVWSEWQTQDVSDEIKDTIADGIRTEYSENNVSLTLLHGQSRLFGDVILPATQDKAGVMSAEDKQKLDEIRDTVVFTGATVDEETEMLVMNRVDGETLVLDEVDGTLPGSITKVSQLENDKGYLTGAVEEESIMLNND